MISLSIDVPPSPANIGDHPFDLQLYSKKLERFFTEFPTFTVNFNPSITDLSPPDSIITGSNDVTFSWKTGAFTSTELFYRSDTDTGYTSVLGLSGREHRVTVKDLPRNHWYYWWVKSRGSWGGIDSSEVRKFYVSNGIVFTQEEYYFGVNHDYDQRVSVGVVNTDSVSHDLLVQVENPYEDIIVGFVDSGSEDDIIPLNPNQTAEVTLAIHAQDARDIDYSFPLSLVSVNRDTIRDFATAHVHINVPHIDVSFEEIGIDQGTLAKNLRITNNGDPLTDLAVFASDEIADKVYFQPVINHAFVRTGEIVDLKAIPTLSLEDSSGKGIVWEDGKVISFPSSLAKTVQGYILASYLGRRDSLYADFSPPPGERIWLAHLDNPGLSVKVHDWYCNNRPNIDVGFQVPSGVTTENIESCELRMEFTPKSGWHHKKHDVHIYVNGHKVGELLNLIPDGTYVFPVDSSFLNLSPYQVSKNVIQLRTKHMNGGHYVLTTNIEVFFCLSEYERYISAPSQEEANERVWNLSGLIRPADEVTVNIQQPLEGASINLGTQTVIKAEVVVDGLPGLGQMARATFSNGDEDLILYDDGQHNDEGSDDGIYGNIWSPQHQEDSCLVMVTAGRCGAWGSDTTWMDIVGPSSLVVDIQSPADGFVVRIPDVQLIRALVRDNFGNPIPGSQTDSVKAAFSTGDKDSVLYDDGHHGDYQANDGIYANTWRPTHDGDCTVTVSAWHPTLASGSDQVSGQVLPIQEVVILGQLSIRADRFVDLGGGVYRAENNVSIGNQLGNAFYLFLGATSTLTFDVNTVTINQVVYVNPAILSLGSSYSVDNIVTFSVDPATGAVFIEGTVHYAAGAIFQSSLSGALVLDLNNGTLGGNIRFDDPYFGVIEASAGSWKLDDRPFFGLNMEVDLPYPIQFTDVSLLKGKVTVGVFMDRGIFRIGLTGGALEFEESGGAFGFDLGSAGVPVTGMLDINLSDLSVTVVEDISIQIYTPTKGEEPRTSNIQARLRQKGIVPPVETGRSGPNSTHLGSAKKGAMEKSLGSEREKTVLIDVGITIKKGTTIRLFNDDAYIYGHITLDLDLVKYVHFTAAEAIIELDWANRRFSFQAWKGIKLGDIFKLDEVESKIILDLAQQRYCGSTRYYPFYFHGVAFKGSLNVVLQEDHREFSGVIEQNFDIVGISFMANGASLTLDESGFHSYGKLHFLYLLDADAHFTFAPEIVEGSFDTEFWIDGWKFGGKNSFNFKPERECMSATASVWLCPLDWLDWCPGGEVTFELCSQFPYFHIGLSGLFASLACPADLHICNCQGICDDSLPGFQSYLVSDSIQVILISRDALDLGCGYTIRVEGWDEGTFDLGLFYPDMSGETGYYATYWGRPSGNSSVSEVDVTTSPDFMMRTDLDGDGIFETTESPDSSGEADLDLSLPVVIAVNVERTSPSSARIGWDTNVPATSQVEYGLTSDYGLSSLFDSTLVLHHSVELTGLQADTTYHFRVISYDDEWRCAASTDRTFACSGKGDVDANGQINILDIIRMVNIILYGIDEAPEPPSHEYQLWAGDCNCDGSVNILDIIKVVNCILYDECEFCEDKVLAKAAGTQGEKAAEVGFLESSAEATTQGVSFAIGLKSSVPAAGLQLELEYEPKDISFEKAKATERCKDLTITSNAEGGKMTVLVYSLKGKTIEVGKGSILELPLKVSPDLLGRVKLHLKEAVLADKDGQPIATKITQSEATPLPREFALSQNYPNPFNPITVIKYQLPKDCKVSLDIYNVLGQRVIRLVNQAQKAGYYTVRWNSKNKIGQEVTSGIYFYRLKAGRFTQVKKMVVLK